MRKIEVEIKGLTPLLMNSPKAMGQSKGRQIVKDYNQDDEAKKSAYWSSEETLSGKKPMLVIPSEVMRAAFMYASSGYRVGKKSAKGILAGVIRIQPEEISLGTDKYEKDIRRCVIQKQGIMRVRAKVKDWKAAFSILYDDKFLPPSHEGMLKEILEEAGSRYGLMDYRPQKGGWFGTFEIIKWKPESVKEKKEG